MVPFKPKHSFLKMETGARWMHNGSNASGGAGGPAAAPAVTTLTTVAQVHQNLPTGNDHIYPFGQKEIPIDSTNFKVPPQEPAAEVQTTASILYAFFNPSLQKIANIARFGSRPMYPDDTDADGNLKIGTPRPTFVNSANITTTDFPRGHPRDDIFPPLPYDRFGVK
jgi:hypothetical protein